MLGNGVGQRRPRHIGGGQPRHRALDVRVDHRSGELAAHCARHRDLAPEASTEFGVGGKVGPDDLHGHKPAARRGAEEDLPHAATAEPTAQPVRTDHPRVAGLQFSQHFFHP